MNSTKERPILYSTAMVQSILENRKTETRRLNGMDEINKNPSDFAFNWMDYSCKKPWCFNQISTLTPERLADRSFHQVYLKCPYGHRGDILWVRETWAETTNVNNLSNWPGRPHIQTDDWEEENPRSAIIYRADGPWQWCDDDGYTTEKSHWKPSIHMPKAAARIWLRIKEVNVERLNIITSEAATAEGVIFSPERGLHHVPGVEGTNHLFPEGAFRELWHSINGRKSWYQNPWVWVVKFEVLSTTGKPSNLKELAQ